LQFKQAAVKSLDRLVRDALQLAGKGGYVKIVTIVKDIADARTPWMVDVLVGRSNTDYNGKFGWFQFLLPIPSFSPSV